MGRAKDGEGDTDRQQQHELLAAIVESSHDAIISKDLNSRITTWNRGAQLVFGYSAEEMIGESVMKLIPLERHSEETDILERIRRGERIDHFETVRRRKDGQLINVSLTISPIRGEGGRIVGASKIARDITERVKAEETQRLLMREVNHRSKNLLAVVEAMVRKTATSTPPAELVNRISQRLQALSAIQNLLIYSEWRGVDLGALARAQTAPYCDGRISFAGPAVMLQPPAAQALGLAFHELATNAVRHGVLVDDAGSINLSWSISGAPPTQRLSLRWRETGRPATAPRKNSFGTTILKRATEDALGGTVSIDHGPNGYSWQLEAATNGMVA
ncbi:MAG: PAS domain S-box protein [Rhizobiaceae bacterium]|nr:PAS domain S-box protein [Rhizobiaceae bacterium]